MERVDVAPSPAAGTTSMSLSLIACHPRIDEPSIVKPSAKLSSVRRLHRDREVLLGAGKVHEIGGRPLEFPPADRAARTSLGVMDGIGSCETSNGEMTTRRVCGLAA